MYIVYVYMNIHTYDVPVFMVYLWAFTDHSNHQKTTPRKKAGKRPALVPAFHPGFTLISKTAWPSSAIDSWLIGGFLKKTIDGLCFMGYFT